MEYRHQEIESKWKKYWIENETYKVNNEFSKPKYFILDMFPYPSGAGLHVGHPLGYIASDIVARYMRMKGYNVLHPMGFDAFGLPAEQYAIQTGVHPLTSTMDNIRRYRQQLENIGMNYDWDRQVITCDKEYYRWTQWIFLKLFSHYYDPVDQKAKPLNQLIGIFEKEGNIRCSAFTSEELPFTAEEWNGFSPSRKDQILMNYRLAFRKESYVNWCEALGTVLANDEIKDGVSERGGHPVEKKPMMQWALRITAYADRLLTSLEHLEWSDSMKLMQSNWIGKSSGAEINFEIKDHSASLKIFTTRPDTIFGVSFMVIAPEHPMIDKLTASHQKLDVESYLEKTKLKTERERQSDSRQMTGVFTGSYCIHPFNGNDIPIWISDYVLIEYGTGAIMAVPGHDQRDHAFATTYSLPVIEVIDQSDIPNIDREAKAGIVINSDFLNGLQVKDAIELCITIIEERGLGNRKNQYRLRDANFSRQRYWGEPIPVAYNSEGQCIAMNPEQLPLELPSLSKIEPGQGGKSPLMYAGDWVRTSEGLMRELDTMPGYAGSSWYFLRYMDPKNAEVFASKESMQYWRDVDLYIGGTEHAVGHLMYSRFWQKFLFDLGLVPVDEPFKKLVNQGMIQGIIENILLVKNSQPSQFISAAMADQFQQDQLVSIPVHVSFVNNYNSADAHLDAHGLIEFVRWKPDYANAVFTDLNGTYSLKEIPEGFKIMTRSEVGKMSKRYHNVVNPDDVIAEYGADVFRMYEMFLGPLEDSKPWDTKGITGVAGFIKKYYRLFYQDGQQVQLSDANPEREHLKILHTCIKKINEDIGNLSLNTCISSFMICVNELRRTSCNHKLILKDLNLLLAPFAPFITEEIHAILGGTGSVHHQSFPQHNDSFLREDNIAYPVCINGKKRYEWTVPVDKPQQELEKEVLLLEEVQKWISDQPIKKVILVSGRMINIVI